MAEANAGPNVEAADTVTVADLAAADNVAGHVCLPADHAMMREGVQKTRAQLVAIREVGLEPDATWPATQFQPLLPGQSVPTGRSRFRLSRDATPAYDGDPGKLAFATVMEMA